MNERFDFRLFEAHAGGFFHAHEGQMLHSRVRRILVGRSDPLFAKVGMVARTLQLEGKRLIATWSCLRDYSPKELDAAEWLLAVPGRFVQTAGELSGTLYDDSEACPRCGDGGRQVTPLRLALGKIPKSADVVRTLAGELVASESLARIATRERLSGVELRAVEATQRSASPQLKWFQMQASTHEVEVIAPTAFGDSPFDLDKEGVHRCPVGHVLGAYRLTELTASRSSLSDLDMQATRAAEGVRLGLFRPEKLLIVSQRFRSAFVRYGLKGLRFEVVRLGPS